MAETVYVLCALTSLFCAGLLGRRYRTHRTRTERLLLWSMLGFIGLAMNNALLVVDLVMVPGIDLSFPRVVVAVAAMSMFMIGLVWEPR